MQRAALSPFLVGAVVTLAFVSKTTSQLNLVGLVPFSALLGNGGGVQLNVSANLSDVSSSVSGSVVVNGQQDVWISFPQSSGVVRLEEGSRLQISNLGMNFNVSKSTNVSLHPVLTLPFFDVDPAASLDLRNVSINTDCDTLYALQIDTCARMPDPDYEVAMWSLRVVRFTTPNLSADNVTLRCGFSATNSTVTYSLLGLDKAGIDSQPVVPAVWTFPCISWRVTDDLEFVNVLLPYPNTRPKAIFAHVVANISGGNAFVRQTLLAPKYKVDIFFIGLPDVPTQLDLAGYTAVISLLNSSEDLDSPSRVEFRDLYLTNLAYGPTTQYPYALIKSTLWFLDYQRTEYTITSRSATLVSLTRVTLMVGSTELWWWRGMVESALGANASSIDQGLIRYFAPGLEVVAADGSMRIPYWEWSNGMTVWTNCSLSATPLVPVAPALYAPREDLLATLSSYGDSRPVPLSAVRFGKQDLDATAFSQGSALMLPDNAQFSSSLVTSRATITSNLTIWGEARSVRFINLQALPGVVTVPTNAALTVRFVNLANPAVGRRGAEPAALQNFTMMFWVFNRTLQPASVTSRRTLSFSGSDAGGAGMQRAVARRSMRHDGGGGWRGSLASAAGRPLVQLARGWKTASGSGPGGRELLADRRSAAGGRRLAQVVSASSNGSSSRNNNGERSNSSDNNSSSIPEGPFRTWLRLENVWMYTHAEEVQLLCELVQENRTSLRVSPDVVEWLRRVLAGAKVRNTDKKTRVSFFYVAWMGIEAVNFTLSSETPPGVSFSLLPPTASILLPEISLSPPTPAPLLSLSPPAVLRSQPPPGSQLPPSPSSVPFTSAPPPLEAGTAASSPSGALVGMVVGAAVGSAACLLLLCGLVALAVVVVRRRRQRARATSAPGVKGLDEEAAGANGTAEGVPSSCAACAGRSPDGDDAAPPPPPPASQARSPAAKRRDKGAGGDGAQGKDQPSNQDTARVGAAAAAAAPAAAAAAAAAVAPRGSGRPPSGKPSRAPGKRRSGSAIDGAGKRQGSRQSGGEDGGGRGGEAGADVGGQPRRSRKVRSSGSGGSGSKSGTGSSVMASDAASTNPRMELYAALAAFQSELGEQQQITIISQLGAGAHGVVYRAEWRGLEVAVKTLLFQAYVGSNSDDTGNSLKEQAMLEAAIATTLFHPNVINTFSYDIKPLRMCLAPSLSTTSSRAETVVSSEGTNGIIDWKLYIIQEYCDGGTLKDALDGCRFTDPDTGMAYQETALRVAIEIASGMSYIHGRNIIHGDLKPANILLRSNSTSPYGFTAKIADFGLALKLKAGESHVSNIRRGTPFYIASELVEAGRATTASDLYSFGVILWELLHGCTVARRLPLRRRIPNLPSEFYTWPADCPPAYRELATACLSSNPAARPRFTHALSALTKLLHSLVEARRQQQQQERRRLSAGEAATKAAKPTAAGGIAQVDPGQDQERVVDGGRNGVGAAEASIEDRAASVSSGPSWKPPLLLGKARQRIEGPTPNSLPVPASADPGAGANAGGKGTEGPLLQERGGGATARDEVTAAATAAAGGAAAAAAAGEAERARCSAGGGAPAVGRAESAHCTATQSPSEPSAVSAMTRSEPSGQAVVDAKLAAASQPATLVEAWDAGGRATGAAPAAEAPAGGAPGAATTQLQASFGEARHMTHRGHASKASTVAWQAESTRLAAGSRAAEIGGGGGNGAGASLEASVARGRPHVGSFKDVPMTGMQQPPPPSQQQLRTLGSMRAADLRMSTGLPRQAAAPAAAGTALVCAPHTTTAQAPPWRGAPACAGFADVHGHCIANSNGDTSNTNDNNISSSNNDKNTIDSYNTTNHGDHGKRPPSTSVVTAAADAASSANPATATSLAAENASAVAAPAPAGGRTSAAAVAAAVAATEAALAALAVTTTLTRNLGTDTAGVLDSCLGSAETRGMDRGFLLDLMPAASTHVHSSRVSSTFGPDLAAAMENMLGVHGVRMDVALGWQSAEAGPAAGAGTGGGGGGRDGLVDLGQRG